MKNRMQGPLSIATPGELRGYWDIYNRFGSLPWADLIQPTIDLCTNGFRITKHMADFITPELVQNAHFRDMFVNKFNNKIYKTGTHIYPPENLCDVYKKIAQNGGDDFYTGDLGKQIAADLKDAGSMVTEDDLRLYSVKWSDSLPITIGTNIAFITPSPSSGPIVAYLLNIFNTMNLNKAQLNQTILHHRLVEAFKFAFAERTKLSDPDFTDMNDLEQKLLSSEYAQSVCNKIMDRKTFNNYRYYGGTVQQIQEHGTSHISIIAPNGDAVAVTSSLNFYFGSSVCGNRTGIIFNSGIDDFSFNDSTNYFDLPISLANFIEPNKRSVTSMAPTIITDLNYDVKVSIGAAGGSKIPTAIAMTLLNMLWFENDVKQAIDAPRIHHQLFPMRLEYEYGLIEEIVNGLKSFGHRIFRYNQRKSIVSAIMKNASGILANIDYRKGGEAVGF